MSKVSIGLRGWRFEEADVFAEDGSFRPMNEMPPDTRTRLSRLTALVNRPCDACWLVHGDEDIQQCNPAAAVYGEPSAEVILCDIHEPDFVYWFREAGGATFRGTDDLEDAFYEWFIDGGRAPEGYGSVEHVETDPDELPAPEEVLQGGSAKLGSGEPINPASSRSATDTTDDGAGDGEDGGTPLDESAVADADLSRDYPR
jgi:hypothetical protein